MRDEFPRKRPAGGMKMTGSQPEDTAPSAEIIGCYRDQCARSDAVLAVTPLHDPLGGNVAHRLSGV
jgi:hypothetical protein